VIVKERDNHPRLANLKLCLVGAGMAVAVDAHAQPLASPDIARLVEPAVFRVFAMIVNAVRRVLVRGR